MAFQPIVDAGSRDIFAYEALVRGVDGEGAADILSLVDMTNRRDFDQQCRITAMECAARLGLKDSSAALSINFMPNAVTDAAACTRIAKAAAEKLNFPTQRIIFEFTEGEQIDDPTHLGRIIAAYRDAGFRTAIDDFGAGYSGLTLLAKFQPDIVKLDMELVRGIDSDRVRRCIVSSIRRMCDELGIVLVAEGIETMGEYAVLRDLGVSLLQGFLFARPQTETLPIPSWPRGR
ncbi:MAG: diguanylate phosphodiesterase [Caulobacterales bacterium 32-69-10]|nr:MAG: diguanylate phosphodiesterase [Caulobacterales bacterium 32-69-10]